MAQITNRQEFKDYCLRRLGFPVIDINIDDEQIEDRIDDAMQYWQDYHFDGLQKVYYIKAVTQQDINQRYIDMRPSVTKDASNNSLNIVGVTRIFPIQDSQATINMFDLRYQLRLNELYDFTSASYINYTLTMQHLRSLEILFTGEVPIRFHHESLTGRDGYSSDYKRDVEFYALSALGEKIENWTLKGAFILDANFGSMDWATEDAVTIELTLKYDYAIHQY